MVGTASSASHRWLAKLGVVSGARKVAPEMAPAALQRLEELEDRIAGLESESEKVFRRLLQARVLLLNIHNPL
jgi:BMFP domain-containing protein YqiC